VASQGAIAAAVIGAVATVAAAVLAVVLPRTLSDPPSEPGGPGPSVVIPGGNPLGEVELFANKESAPVGATVLVSGRGFGASESIEIIFGAQTAATTRAGKGGDFANVSVKVPEFFKGFAKPMQVDITAVGKSSIRSARVAFTISG